jgi:hypothetical protein
MVWHLVTTQSASDVQLPEADVPSVQVAVAVSQVPGSCVRQVSKPGLPHVECAKQFLIFPLHRVGICPLLAKAFT